MIKRLEWNKKTATLVLGVVFTFSIVTIFLSGRGITIAENTMLEPVVWTFQRPKNSVLILDKLDATYADGVSANMYVLIIRYLNESQFGDAYDFLHISMAINATTSNPNGYIESVNVLVQKDQESTLGWEEIELENLSLAARAVGYRWETQAYIKLAGVNHTGSVHAWTITHWKLRPPNTQSHQLEVAYEIVYYNGTAYNKVVQPFQLNIVGRET